MKKQKAKTPILDACCGSRMFWFDKKNPLVTFMDIRNENHVLCDGRKLEIKPDVIGNFKNIPFKSNSFKLTIFDPPHLRSAGISGWQAKKYGTLGANWREEIRLGFNECLRVLETGGVLIFKWNEQTIKVSEVIKVIGRGPLFGHRTLQSSKTIWMAFLKTEEDFF